jgi:hypothetical protein
MPITNPQSVVDRLIGFQKIVRDTLIASRNKQALHEVSHSTAADTIYKIDTEVEPLLEHFCAEWAKETPLVLISEGLEDEHGNDCRSDRRHARHHVRQTPGLGAGGRCAEQGAENEFTRH